MKILEQIKEMNLQKQEPIKIVRNDGQEVFGDIHDIDESDKPYVEIIRTDIFPDNHGYRTRYISDLEETRKVERTENIKNRQGLKFPLGP